MWVFLSSSGSPEKPSWKQRLFVFVVRYWLQDRPIPDAQILIDGAASKPAAQQTATSAHEPFTLPVFSLFGTTGRCLGHQCKTMLMPEIWFLGVLGPYSTAASQVLWLGLHRDLQSWLGGASRARAASSVLRRVLGFMVGN